MISSLYQFPQQLQYYYEFLRFCDNGWGGFSFGLDDTLFSLLFIIRYTKFSNISFTFCPDLAEVSAKGILNFYADYRPSYLASVPPQWKLLSWSPCLTCCRWGCWRSSGWRSCSSPHTTCWHSRSCRDRSDRRRWGCHQRHDSTRWWWSWIAPGRRCPTGIRKCVRVQLWPSPRFCQRTWLSAWPHKYEINADGVEHVLRELVLLHDNMNGILQSALTDSISLLHCSQLVTLSLCGHYVIILCVY